MAAPSWTQHSTKERTNFTIGKGLIYLVLAFWAFMVIFPMLWATISSFKTDQEIFFSPWGLPGALQWDNFARAWTKAKLGIFFLNTIIVIIPAITLTLLLSSMAAYVLARFEFRGKQIVFYLFLTGMMFPIFLALVPLYFVMQFSGLLNTVQGLVLVYVAFSLPFTVFFLTGFFKTLPTEMAEAAMMDGASHYRIFFNVMLPLAAPALVSVGIFNFLGQWNQFILPNVLISNAGLDESQSRYVLSQGLYYLYGQQFYQSDWSGLFAAVTLVTIPTLLVYIIFHDRIEAGLTVGALKG
ncbi:MAG: carbohydrate ABC transporter permease [Chloroflexi bacterium]|nr:carbohydrate ABC transporter permease [Chloroflexota bacterium]